ncbi:UNVERIFIED_CONTAM: hypothetical protein HDU68_003918 [Siphonaria sp. JEL0065]|nr:hypothetical protein HDU68_003918 [Siphonaria sp. JEL0065]
MLPTNSLLTNGFQFELPYGPNHFTAVISREFGFDAVFISHGCNEIDGETANASVTDKKELLMTANLPASVSQITVRFMLVVDGVYKCYILSKTNVLALAIVVASGKSTEINSVGGFIESSRSVDQQLNVLAVDPGHEPVFINDFTRMPQCGRTCMTNQVQQVAYS